MKKYYQSVKLVDRINWDAIIPLPRYAGGHDEQMKNLLKDVTIIAHWNEGDYQGMVATCVQLNDTKEVVIYNDYYGSCSGCDAWEDATDDEVREMCRQLATGAYIFKSLEDCLEFLAEGDTETSFDWETPRLPLLREIRFSQILCDPAILARLKTHGFEECGSSHDTCDQCDVFSSRLWVDDDGEYCLDCALKKIQSGEDFLKNFAVWAEENKCPECGFPDDAKVCMGCGHVKGDAKMEDLETRLKCFTAWLHAIPNEAAYMDLSRDDSKTVMDAFSIMYRSVGAYPSSDFNYFRVKSLIKRATINPEPFKSWLNEIPNEVTKRKLKRKFFSFALGLLFAGALSWSLVFVISARISDLEGLLLLIAGEIPLALAFGMLMGYFFPSPRISQNQSPITED